MATELGTRRKSTGQQTHGSSRSLNTLPTRDPGAAKLATAALTFSAGTGKVSAANGTFSAFVAGDPVLFGGTNLNGGEFLITASDAVNGAWLSLDPPPKSEGPVTATARTP